ncbi:hypothetical protein PC114_g18605 [Phytophthora cactorum]|uniref:Phosphate transporter n=1 Tax=Phytophthora cactorum TaxID=29920 RepID=A0A8T1C3R4_9STRA|nr:hypothetical protein PC114_g18605 [Phytophthora cactorum]KAG2915246.1 hypothetical protein PC117_g18074 [Phytophthora cactorum]KAG3015108.1 hypothetical protein PC120_g12351 [Phytophthora cactorum]KAG3180041.1 hypothetical protein PC128_g15726 [Phytophthora cactorum]KAG4053174.1 hypothetical protein PC123_g11681 [Phytophthora cactorum]
MKHAPTRKHSSGDSWFSPSVVNVSVFTLPGASSRSSESHLNQTPICLGVLNFTILSAQVVDCAVGVFDCAVEDDGATCAAYNDKYWSLQSSEWMLVFGFVVMAGMAWQVGANDVVSAFGTSVGSRAISCRMA